MSARLNGLAWCPTLLCTSADSKLLASVSRPLYCCTNQSASTSSWGCSSALYRSAAWASSCFSCSAPSCTERLDAGCLTAGFSLLSLAGGFALGAGCFSGFCSCCLAGACLGGGSGAGVFGGSGSGLSHLQAQPRCGQVQQTGASALACRQLTCQALQRQTLSWRSQVAWAPLVLLWCPWAASAYCHPCCSCWSQAATAPLAVGSPSQSCLLRSPVTVYTGGLRSRVFSCGLQA